MTKKETEKKDPLDQDVQETSYRNGLTLRRTFKESANSLIFKYGRNVSYVICRLAADFVAFGEVIQERIVDVLNKDDPKAAKLFRDMVDQLKEAHSDIQFQQAEFSGDGVKLGKAGDDPAKLMEDDFVAPETIEDVPESIIRAGDEAEARLDEKTRDETRREAEECMTFVMDLMDEFEVELQKLTQKYLDRAHGIKATEKGSANLLTLGVAATCLSHGQFWDRVVKEQVLPSVADDPELMEMQEYIFQTFAAKKLQSRIDGTTVHVNPVRDEKTEADLVKPKPIKTRKKYLRAGQAEAKRRTNGESPWKDSPVESEMKPKGTK